MAGTNQNYSILDDQEDAAISLSEMRYLKRQQASPDHDASKSPCLARQGLPTSSPNIDAGAHIKLYSYYVIDQSKLPSTAPDQLKSIRVVMVSEKSKNRVGVRFPSFNSLGAHFSSGESGKPARKTMPSLDEKYVMELDVAEEVVYRRVPPQEIGENRNSWSFWVVCSDVKNVPKMGLCWSLLKSGAGMVKWGKTRKVQYLGRYEEEKKNDQEEEKEEEEVKSDEKNRKRRLCLSANCDMQKRAKKKMKAIKSSSGRWSKERYKLAEVNMLKILKEKGAMFGRPIMRPALRTEARKLIGDTGLLDHLLKHMAGKVAPGGQERFRRRHNADGAMEYWLESADLVSIRKEAGVQDPYWTPPAGWRPGDSPTQDPVCARELKQLKEAVANLSRDMQNLLSKKQEDDMAIVATPASCITSQTLEQDSFLHQLKEMYMDLMGKKSKIEEQLMEFSYSLFSIEQKMEKQKSLDGPKKPESALIESTSSGTEKETKEKNEETTTEEAATTPAESKSEKIERLKSGFRICKPKGTFLWPSMAMSPPAISVASTPTSVSSSTASASRILAPAPVKHSDPGLLINLNEFPSNQILAMPCLVASKKDEAMEQSEEVEGQKLIRECENKCREASSSSTSPSTCFSTGSPTWFASGRS